MNNVIPKNSLKDAKFKMKNENLKESEASNPQNIAYWQYL